MADLAPEAGALVRLAELERALQLGEALVEVVAFDRELGRTPQPAERPHAEPLELLGLVRPGEIGVLGAGGLRVVVGEQGRVLVAPTARPLEPGGDQRVEPCTPRLGHAVVDDLPGQRVLERVLRLTPDRRRRPEADETAVLQDRPGDRLTADELQGRSAPEDAADHGRGLERGLVAALEPVDARREDRLDRIRQLLGRAGLDEGCQQLLEKERIPLGSFDQCASRPVRELAGNQLVEHCCGLARRQGVQPDERGVPAATAPRTAAVEQLGTRGPDHEQRAANLAANPLEQVEQRVLSPVQVLDEQNRRRFRRQLAEELDPRLLEAVADGKGVRAAGEVEPQSEPEDLPLAEPPARLLLRFALQDSQVLSQNLTERPVGEVAVGQTPPRVLNGLRRVSGEPPPELLHQRRLPDTRVADQRDDVRLPLLDRVVEDRLQQLELGAAADEGSRAASEAPRPHQRQCAHERLRHHRFGLALRVDRKCRPELERAVHRLGRSGANDGRTRLRRLLEPGGDVDHVAGDERTAQARLPCDDLPGVHADAELEPPVEDRSQALLHRERGMQGALSVVLERLRDAEDGHDRVAGELLDCSPGTADLVGHRLVEALEQHARSLRILLVGERRRADEVGEEHSGQLALGGLHAGHCDV